MMPYLSCKKIKNDVYNFPTWQYCKYKDIFDSRIIINSTAKFYISISYQKDLLSIDTRIFTPSLLTLVLIFASQTEVILSNPLHIVLIAVPLTIQTFLIFFIAYFACKFWKLPHDVAAPAGMIGASNFFELSVAVAIALFGTTSPAALATTVGVLTEVPVMLTLVNLNYSWNNI